MHLVLLERRRKKKNDRTLHTSSEPEIEKPPEDNNDVSISDAKTQSGNEHSPYDNEKDNDEVHEDTQTNNKEPDNDVEIESVVDLDNPQQRIKDMIKENLLLKTRYRKRTVGSKTYAFSTQVN